MDKYAIVFDIIEHPEKYSSHQIDDILSDSEAKEIYNLLCKSTSALAAHQPPPDTEAEWNIFTNCHNKNRRRFLWIGNRAASIAILTLTSIAALAIGAAVSVRVINRQHTEVAETTHTPSTAVKTKIENNAADKATDTIQYTAAPILFEQESLETILSTIAYNYNLEVTYLTPSAKGLRLYYKFNPTMSINDIVEQLNTFEQINIHIDHQSLIVD